MNSYHLEILLDIRRMGMLRGHTFSSIKPYSAAEHSYYLSMLVNIYHKQLSECVFGETPDPRRTTDMILYALHHDLGELVTGDIPAPFKVCIPNIKKIEDKIDVDQLNYIYSVRGDRTRYTKPEFCPEDVFMFKLFDMMEFLLSRCYEYLHGNKLAMVAANGECMTINFAWMERHLEELGYADRLDNLRSWGPYKELSCFINAWVKESRGILTYSE